MSACGAVSIFSQGFGKSLMETDVKARSFIASSQPCTIDSGEMHYVQ